MATQKKTEVEPVIPIHQWTNGGDEVLCLRFVAKDGLSHSGIDRSGKQVGFRWPLEVGATVEAPDWVDDGKCGGGLHGWPWGTGIGSGKQPDWQATWLVWGCAPTDVREVTEGDPGKVKARIATIRFVGGWHDALHFVLAGRHAWSAYAARGSASNSGDSGSASNSGYSGSASNSGDRGSASNSGDSGSASNSGDRGSASNSGYRGSAEATGLSSAAVSTGSGGRARAGAFGCIALAWENNIADRMEMRCAETGVGDGSDGKLKAHVWYRLDATGAFVETLAATQESAKCN